LIWINRAAQVFRDYSAHHAFCGCDMNDLMASCNEAMRIGVDFPTLWHTVIKPHPSVVGVPVQRLDGHRTYLEIPLLRGDWLVVDTDSRTISLR
jgi:hypothetical protein